MRLRGRLQRVAGAILCGAVLAGCATSIRDLNLRPERNYQKKVSVSGRIMRLQRVDGDTLLEIADQRENRLLVRASRPVDVSVGEWVKATGVLVPEARVAGTSLYDVLVAEEVSRTRGPWLPSIM
jgi:hypothetical protein